MRSGQASRQEAHQTMQSACDRATAAGLRVVFQAQEEARTWYGITGAAHSCHADLVVMGLDAPSSLNRLTRSSVAEHVLQRSMLPVLVVRT
ncbi:universal stress protein [Rhodoferax lacus]